MRVLLSVFDCNPRAGSEGGVGWNWAIQLSRLHEVTALTREVNRQAIEDNAAEQPDSLTFHYFDAPDWEKRVSRLPYAPYLYYDIWQRAVVPEAARLHAKAPFDLAQHLTWGAWRHPSFLHRIGVPLVFGPVGGGDSVPYQLRKSMRPRDRLWELARDLGNRAYLGLPSLWECFDKSALIFCRTAGTRSYIPKRYWAKTRIHREIGVDESLLVESTARPARSGRLRVLYVGRFISGKGAHLAVRAFAAFARKYPDAAEFDLVGGQGYLKQEIEELVRVEGLGESVRIHGWLPHDEVRSMYLEYDVFLFPSLRDSGGTVVLESLAAGLPVICLDLGGPPNLLGGRGGVVVAAGGLSEDQVVGGLARALEQFHLVPESRVKLSTEARARAAELTWANTVRSVYRQVGEAVSPAAVRPRGDGTGSSPQSDIQ